jgi:MFS family permease
MSTSDLTVTQPIAIPRDVRRNTMLLAGVQAAGWVTIQTIATLGGITADLLTADKRWIGVPVTLNIIASALTAPVAGRLMDRIGRRPVVAIGLGLLLVGTILAGISIASGLLSGFLAAIVLMGIGIACTNLSRSAAADMYPPSRRAQGLGVVVMGGAVGAVLGPFMLLGLAEWADANGFNPDVAPWLGLPPILALALVGVSFIRPDPRTIASRLNAYYPGEVEEQESDTAPARSMTSILRHYPVAVAVAATGLVQAGMVMLMVTAALSMKGHGHGDAVFPVMSAHFFGMLALSVPIGRLADRLGRRPMILVGALIFIAGATTAPLINDPVVNGTSLFLVGLGWSFCYVAGNTILADLARPSERGRLLGANDLIVGMTGAVASLLGGVILSDAGFLTVGTIGLVLGLVPMLLALRLRETRPGHYSHESQQP